MDLDKIQEMWQRDSVIDPDNLHDESLKIPQLHSKYYTVYNTVTLMREKAREQYNKTRLERYNYYTGKAPAEVYVEEPFGYKVREKDAIQRHMEADEKMVKIDLKIRYYDTTLKFLEEIIKNVSNRTFQIKNAIEWNKFQAGMQIINIFVYLDITMKPTPRESKVIHENYEKVVEYLISEQYAQDAVAADKIISGMSQDWFDTIVG